MRRTSGGTPRRSARAVTATATAASAGTETGACGVTMVGLAMAFAVAAAVGCVPDVPRDPVPEEMDYDLQSVPPRAPQPTNLVVNKATGHVDFSLAGISVATDCATSQTLSQAECELDQYLQSLDGFPTVTPASAPASAPLDPATLTLGQNVVVLDATTGAPVTDVTVGFDTVGNQLTVKPTRSWALGGKYWIGVRGYASGVRAASGSEVVGSPTHALFKQDSSLTCGAEPPADIRSDCPGLKLLSQTMTPMAAAMALFQLEPIRLAYQLGGGFELMAAAGLPKDELAVLWGFPIHTSSVAELDPTVGLVPRVTAANELHVAVQGTVNPATVTAVAVMQKPGSVLLMDLTAAAGGDLVSGFPRADAAYAAGDIVITAAAPFVAGHQYGVFITNAVLDTGGAPLVPSPVSVLLTLKGALVDTAGHSTISTVGDSDAAMLDVGRRQLATLFDNPVFQPLTGVSRANLVYCFAFPFGGTP